MAYKGHGLNFFRSLTHLQRAIISVFLFPLVPTLSFQIQMQPMLGSPLCSFIFSSPHFDLRKTDIHFDLYNSFRPQTFNAWSKISIFGAIRKVLAWLLHWLMGQRSPILGILSFKGRWIHSKQDVHFFLFQLHNPVWEELLRYHIVTSQSFKKTWKQWWVWGCWEHMWKHTIK